MVLSSQFPEGGAAGREGTGEGVLSPKGRGGGSAFWENGKGGPELQSLMRLGFEQLKSGLGGGGGGWLLLLPSGPVPGADVGSCRDHRLHRPWPGLAVGRPWWAPWVGGS